MAFAIAALGGGNHQGQYQILEKYLELLTGALIAQFMEQASFCVLECQMSQSAWQTEEEGRESKAEHGTN